MITNDLLKRALDIVASNGIEKVRKGVFKVTGESGTYAVRIGFREGDDGDFCGCPDFLYRRLEDKKPCKHILSCKIYDICELDKE